MVLRAVMRRATWLKFCCTRRLCSFFDGNSTETTGYNLKDVSVGEDYGIVRSFIGGAEVRVLNTRVPDPIISAIN